MCGSPKTPKALPQRQAARAPDAGAIAMRTSDSLRKRMGFAGSMFAPSLLAPALTTGKTLLGQ